MDNSFHTTYSECPPRKPPQHWEPPSSNVNCPLPSLTSKWAIMYCWWPVSWGLILNYCANKNSTTNSTLIVTALLEARLFASWMELRLQCVTEVRKSSKKSVIMKYSYLLTVRLFLQPLHFKLPANFRGSLYNYRWQDLAKYILYWRTHSKLIMKGKSVWVGCFFFFFNEQHGTSFCTRHPVFTLKWHDFGVRLSFFNCNIQSITSGLNICHKAQHY